MNDDCVARAKGLVGTRFRSQGREAVTGVDCVGLAILAYGLEPARFPRDYRLRGLHRPALLSALATDFRRVWRTRCRPGDLMLMAVRDDQFHLAIRTPGGFVHADARLARVVETPGLPTWPMIGVYRRRSRKKKGR